MPDNARPTKAQRRARLRELREALRSTQMRARMAAGDLRAWRRKAREIGAEMRAVRYGVR